MNKPDPLDYPFDDNGNLRFYIDMQKWRAYQVTGKECGLFKIFLLWLVDFNGK